jgi:acyl-CoA reductase-like NAD-dependent aldehyde dehydrogenase
VPIADATDVAAAVVAAEVPAPSWGRLDPLDRGRQLRALADIVQSRLPALTSLESAITGRPIREMRAQMSRIPEWLDYFGGIAPGLEGESNRLRGGFLAFTGYEPHGVCVLLTPWNQPVLILVKKFAAARASGNVVIVKPSELAPLTPLLIADWRVEAGMPAGIVNVVSGDSGTGAALCAAPAVQHIDLTGGTDTGRSVAAAAGARIVPCTLELGDKAPVIIWDDVAVAEAAAGVVFAAFGLTAPVIL